MHQKNSPMIEVRFKLCEKVPSLGHSLVAIGRFRRCQRLIRGFGE
jgi:hypothetical protein